MEGALLSKAVFAVAGPVEAEAYKAHGVAAIESFLLVINAYGSIGQNGSCAIGRTTRTDGLGRSESFALIGRKGDGNVLTMRVVRSRLEDNIPGVAVKG